MKTRKPNDVPAKAGLRFHPTPKEVGFQRRLLVKPKPKKVVRIYRVVRTDMEGNEEVFRNIREAARASDLAASTVGDICHGKPTRVTKYTFRFADE